MKRTLASSFLLSPFLIFLFAGDLYAQGDFVYTNNNVEGPNTICGFSIAPSGMLTQIPGSPFLTGGIGSGFGAFAANRIRVLGNLLFASNSRSKDISVFSIDPATGFLSLVLGSPIPSQVFGANGISLALTSNGNFLFAAGVDSNTIKAFRVGSNGSLTPVLAPAVPTGGTNILGINASPDNKFLAVTQNFFFVPGTEVRMFSIGDDGSLTPVPGSPFRVGGEAATSAEFNCASNLLFVGEHSGPTTTDVFNVASNGTLTPIQGSPFIQNSGNIGNSGQVVALSPNEQFLFVSNTFSNTVTVWSVAPSGSLALVPGSSFWVGGDDDFREPGGMATNRDGTFLYVANDNFPDSHAVSVFSINGIGALTLVPGSPFETGQRGELSSLAAYPAKTCAAVPAFDLCLQDDSNGNMLQLNLTTGEYKFTRCSDGSTLTGTGTVAIESCSISLKAKSSDHTINASVNTCQNTASSTVLISSRRRLTTLSITDTDTSNNTCSCPNSIVGRMDKSRLLTR